MKIQSHVVAEQPYPVVVITIEGYIEHALAGTLSMEMAMHVAQNRVRLVLDCTKAHLLCSAAYGAIAHMTAQCRTRRGDLRLAGVNATLAKHLMLLHLVDHLTICSTVDVAVATFQQ